MKKKITTTLAVMMAVGAASAFAANPFVDVPSDSWAYKSVVELADAGIIQGVDGEHFRVSATLPVMKLPKWLLKPWLTWIRLLLNSVP